MMMAWRPQSPCAPVMYSFIFVSAVDVDADVAAVDELDVAGVVVGAAVLTVAVAVADADDVCLAVVDVADVDVDDAAVDVDDVCLAVVDADVAVVGVAG